MPVSAIISATDKPFPRALATSATFSAPRPAGRPIYLPCCLANAVPAKLFSRLADMRGNGLANHYVLLCRLAQAAEPYTTVMVLVKSLVHKAHLRVGTT